MIKKFKIFEKKKNKIDLNYKTFKLNELLKYLKTYKELNSFLNSLLMGRKVGFDCANCVKTIDGVKNYIYSNKKHEGIVIGIGFGLDKENKNIYLTLSLKGQKYDHIVDIKTRFKVFGDLEPRFSNIIDDIILKSKAKKYNL